MKTILKIKTIALGMLFLTGSVFATPTAMSVSSVTPNNTCYGPAAVGTITFIKTSGSGNWDNGNVFTVELSDASGSFTSPITIGTLSSKTVNPISVTIPLNTPVGTGYQIRVTSSSPVLTSTNSVGFSVDPNATIFLTSNEGSDDQSLCVNNAITNITYNIEGGGTNGIVSGLPDGVTGLYNSGVFTISGTPTIDGVFNYTVTTTGSCIQTSASGIISIYNCIPPSIKTSDCNRILSDKGVYTSCTYVPNAIQYEFQLVDGVGNQVTTLIRDKNYFNFYQMSGWDYNTTYYVSARALVGSSWTEYGSSCPITTPSIILPSIIASDCNRIFNSKGDYVTSTGYVNATQYEFQLVDGNGNQVTTLIRDKNYFNFYQISGWIPDSTYMVSVRAYANGYWTNYGPSCQITTPSITPPTMTAGSCGHTISSKGQYLFCTRVGGATQYEYKMVDGDGNSVATLVRTKTYFNFYQISGWSWGSTYDISVRAYVNGNWTAFGSSCSVSMSLTGRLLDNSTSRYANDNETDETIIEQPTTLHIYPNPNSGEELNVNLENLTPNSTLTITDIYGKTIVSKSLNTNRSTYNVNVKFDTKLTAGLYFITLVSAENKIVEKLIVK